MLSLRNGWLSLFVRPWERNAVCSDTDIGIADKDRDRDSNQLRAVRRSIAVSSALRESKARLLPALCRISRGGKVHPV